MLSIKKWVVWIPAICVMTMIFHFSSAQSEESSNLSGGIIRNTIDMIDSVFHLQMDEVKKIELMETFQKPIRKLAHMTEYMVLAITVMFALCVDGMKGKKRILVAALISIGYACTDEFHQLFIEGRSGQIIDIFVDSIGVFVGVGIFNLIYRIMYKFLSKE